MRMPFAPPCCSRPSRPAGAMAGRAAARWTNGSLLRLFPQEFVRVFPSGHYQKGGGRAGQLAGRPPQCMLQLYSMHVEFYTHHDNTYIHMYHDNAVAQVIGHFVHCVHGGRSMVV